MQIEMLKSAGGVFVPALDHDLPRLNRFKNGEQYTVKIKLTRNPAFHRKMFAFFHFCFEHWCADMAGLEGMDEHSQFEKFRNDLTILAGFHYRVFNIRGDVRFEAKSLAYANMGQEEFERCYSALIEAAIQNIFSKTDNKTINSRLLSFF